MIKGWFPKRKDLNKNSNMILITQTEKKQYHAVEVPVDAKEIEPLANGIIFTSNGLSNSLRLWELCGKFEIIGIQGGGESLTEEQAIEVLYHNDLQAYEYDGSEALQFLKVVLKDLGIETENPYKKPESEDFISGCSTAGCTGVLRGCGCFASKQEYWEQAESKLKKVVIIKSDK